MKAKTLQDLFVHSLSDIYSAEKQLTKALPLMSRAATDDKLREIFTSHLEETQHQIERIDQVVEAAGLRLKRIKCAAMEGLVEEGKEVIDEISSGPVLDAALVGAAQKVEHYEIASYGTLLALAKQLNQPWLSQVTTLLQETLEEEKQADQKLTAVAEGGINQAAEEASPA
ncbi:MAG: hypothetical protein JWQ88_362 [Rhodoferax sp.]|nr:hypothetical protein [Rhodoferax sp.]